MRNDLASVVELAGRARRRPRRALGPPCRLGDIAAPYSSATDLHPDLALLMSTSGSTGSAKLVRLSRENVTGNARAIAVALAIRPTDVAITSLPLHYCYGLSVLTSHLAPARRSC